MYKQREPADVNIGEELTNQKIVEIFKCGNQGGMRRSTKKNCLVLITDHTKSLYHDRMDSEGVLHYTGMGKIGDQTLSRQNKTLYNSRISDIKILFFEKYSEKSLYKFIGEVELINEPYQEIQADEKGELRKVYVFPLSLINAESFPPILASDLYEITKHEEKKVRKLSIEDIIEKANSSNNTLRKTYRRNVSEQYNRNEYVKEYARRRANGDCDLCEESAPFESNKVPFLEIHHVEWLARGGPDTINNVVALCPNCHRKVHMLDNTNDVNKLKEKAKLKLVSY